MKKPKASTRREKIRLAISAAIVIALAAVVLAQLPGPRPTSARRAGDSDERERERAPWWSWGGRDRSSSERPSVNHLAPWESTAANTPDPGPGYIAAWRLNPPRPPVDRTPPPPPQEPPNPQLTRPSMFNAGGVNGSRPPRPVPGLAGAQ